MAGLEFDDAVRHGDIPITKVNCFKWAWRENDTNHDVFGSGGLRHRTH